MARRSSNTSDLTQRTFARILLVKPSSLGDVIHALPVLHGLRTRYPAAKIDWLIASPFAALLEHHDELDDLVVFDRQRFSRVGRSFGVTSEFLAFIRGLRARQYDLVIDLQGLFRTGFLTRASGAPVRIGFRNAREGAWMFYTHHLRIDDNNMHAVDRNYRVSQMLGFEDVAVEFRLPLIESARSEARSLLRDHDISDGSDLVSVVPGARWETKRWPVEHFAVIIAKAKRHFGFSTVILGSPAERPLAKRLEHLLRKFIPAARIENLAGGTNLKQLAAVLKGADLLLTNDSGPMHFAAGLGTPVLGIFTCTDPVRSGPPGDAHELVRIGAFDHREETAQGLVGHWDLPPCGLASRRAAAPVSRRSRPCAAPPR